MSYTESKSIPQDIFIIIGRFLPYKTINILNQTKNPSFSNNSYIHKEYFAEQYPFINENHAISDYKKELETIHQYKSVTDYACSRGYQTFIEQTEDIPSKTALKEAYLNGYIEIVEYVHKKHYKDKRVDDDSCWCACGAFSGISSGIMCGVVFISLFIITLNCGSSNKLWLDLFFAFLDIVWLLFGIPLALITVPIVWICMFFVVYAFSIYRKPWSVSKDDEFRKLIHAI